ncbi:hypothetical protein RhiJN_11313 [Ceratobasidium sp. AG-Ba]|nr:hypothetical protein RhiJN_11313 [Ceratobasidium sp. AG-Ba]
MTRLNIPLFIALAASLLAAADARSNTLPHQRMIRKRLPGSFNALPRWEGLQERQLIPGLGGNDDQPSGSASATASGSRTSSAAASPTASSSKASTSAAAATTSSAATSSAPTTSAQATQSASTTSGGLLDSLTGLLGGTSSTSSTVSTTSASSTSSSAAPTTSSASSVAPVTSQPPQTTPPTPTLNLATSPPAANTVAPSVAIITSTPPAAVASEQAAAKARTAKITKNTIISLVVIASCIGGAAAIWTVIRKWKLSPSEKFDDRMQPIDWAPTTGATGMREETIEEKRHRRAGSAGSHGSFTSGGVGQSESHDFPPPHDFTAGAGNYGQYYQGQHQQYAYADLQRGPSVTESNYSHGASVSRGLSYSRGHGGYEAQPGAGGVPPLPNPYGGGYKYEDYGRQQGQAQGQGQGQYRAY